MPRKIIAFIISFCLIFEQAGFAQVAPQLGVPAYLQNLVPVADKFRPIHLRSLSLDPATNNFELLLDKGDSKQLQKPQIEEATKKLLEYFQVGLALPNSMFWVNLRPDAPKDVIDPHLEKTDMGRVLLESDLQLKKDIARFTSPDTVEGRQYWTKLYQKADSIYGGQDIEIPTLTRPWIVPGEIIIGESKDSAYIYKATFKVMLEQDYLKDVVYTFDDDRAKEMNAYSSQIVRELIIPKLTREVNSSKRYAGLRQVYYSLILAQWFKQRYKGKQGVYASRIDSQDLTGLVSKTAWSKDTYFKAYQKSFKNGEYNRQETVFSQGGETIRSYFSGGLALNTLNQAIAPIREKAAIVINNLNTNLPNNLKATVDPAGNVRIGPVIESPEKNGVKQSDLSAPASSMQKERIEEVHRRIINSAAGVFRSEDFAKYQIVVKKELQGARWIQDTNIVEVSERLNELEDNDRAMTIGHEMAHPYMDLAIKNGLRSWIIQRIGTTALGFSALIFLVNYSIDAVLNVNPLGIMAALFFMLPTTVYIGFFPQRILEFKTDYIGAILAHAAGYDIQKSAESLNRFGPTINPNQPLFDQALVFLLHYGIPTTAYRHPMTAWRIKNLKALALYVQTNYSPADIKAMTNLVEKIRDMGALDTMFLRLRITAVMGDREKMPPKGGAMTLRQIEDLADRARAGDAEAARQLEAARRDNPELFKEQARILNKATISYGDLHGDSEVARQALEKAKSAALSGDYLELNFHGDLFDRGAGNKEVFAIIRELKALAAENPNINVNFVIGNHDVMMIQALLFDNVKSVKNTEAAKVWEKWYNSGGNEVMKEFGFDLEKLKELAIWMLKNVKLFHVDDLRFLHVHAGIPVDNEGNLLKDEKGKLRFSREILDKWQKDLETIQGKIAGEGNITVEFLTEIGLEEFLNRINERDGIVWVREDRWLDKIGDDPTKYERLLAALGVNGIIFGHIHLGKVLNIGNKYFGIDVNEGNPGALIFKNGGIRFDGKKGSEVIVPSRDGGDKDGDQAYGGAVQTVGGKTAVFTPEAWQKREEMIKLSEDSSREILIYGLGEAKDGIFWIKEMVAPDMIIQTQHVGAATADLKIMFPTLFFDTLLKKALIYSSFNSVEPNSYYLKKLRELAAQKGLAVLYQMHTHVLKNEIHGLSIARNLDSNDQLFTEKLRNSEYAKYNNGSDLFLHEQAIRWTELVLIDGAGNKALFSDLPVDSHAYLERHQLLNANFKKFVDENEQPGQILLGDPAEAWLADRLAQGLLMDTNAAPEMDKEAVKPAEFTMQDGEQARLIITRGEEGILLELEVGFNNNAFEFKRPADKKPAKILKEGETWEYDRQQEGVYLFFKLEPNGKVVVTDRLGELKIDYAPKGFILKPKTDTGPGGTASFEIKKGQVLQLRLKDGPTPVKAEFKMGDDGTLWAGFNQGALWQGGQVLLEKSAQYKNEEGPIFDYSIRNGNLQITNRSIEPLEIRKDGGDKDLEDIWDNWEPDDKLAWAKLIKGVDAGDIRNMHNGLVFYVYVEDGQGNERLEKIKLDFYFKGDEAKGIKPDTIKITEYAADGVTEARHGWYRMRYTQGRANIRLDNVSIFGDIIEEQRNALTYQALDALLAKEFGIQNVASFQNFEVEVGYYIIYNSETGKYRLLVDESIENSFYMWLDKNRKLKEFNAGVRVTRRLKLDDPNERVVSEGHFHPSGDPTASLADMISVESRMKDYGEMIPETISAVQPDFKKQPLLVVNEYGYEEKAPELIVAVQYSLEDQARAAQTFKELYSKYGYNVPGEEIRAVISRYFSRQAIETSTDYGKKDKAGETKAPAVESEAVMAKKIQIEKAQKGFSAALKVNVDMERALQEIDKEEKLLNDMGLLDKWKKARKPEHKIDKIIEKVALMGVVRSFGIKALIERVVDNAEVTVAPREYININDKTNVTSYEGNIDDFISNILGNAKKYASVKKPASADEPEVKYDPVEIQVEFIPETKQVRIKIRDFGPGMTRKVIAGLLDENDGQETAIDGQFSSKWGVPYIYRTVYYVLKGNIKLGSTVYDEVSKRYVTTIRKDKIDSESGAITPVLDDPRYDLYKTGIEYEVTFSTDNNDAQIDQKLFDKDIEAVKTIRHNILNKLSAITGYVQLFEMKLKMLQPAALTPEMQSKIKKVLESSSQINAIISATKDGGYDDVMTLGELAQGTARLLNKLDSDAARYNKVKNDESFDPSLNFEQSSDAEVWRLLHEQENKDLLELLINGDESQRTEYERLKKAAEAEQKVTDGGKAERVGEAFPDFGKIGIYENMGRKPAQGDPVLARVYSQPYQGQEMVAIDTLKDKEIVDPDIADGMLPDEDVLFLDALIKKALNLELAYVIRNGTLLFNDKVVYVDADDKFYSIRLDDISDIWRDRAIFRLFRSTENRPLSYNNITNLTIASLAKIARTKIADQIRTREEAAVDKNKGDYALPTGKPKSTPIFKPGQTALKQFGIKDGGAATALKKDGIIPQESLSADSKETKIMAAQDIYDRLFAAYRNLIPLDFEINTNKDLLEVSVVIDDTTPGASAWRGKISIHPKQAELLFEDELAYALAHEIGHHIAAYTPLLYAPGYYQAGFIQEVFNKYSARQFGLEMPEEGKVQEYLYMQEYIADAIALRILAVAGFSLNGSLTAFQHMRQIQTGYTNQEIKKILESDNGRKEYEHPQDGDRVSRMARLIEFGWPFLLYTDEDEEIMSVLSAFTTNIKNEVPPFDEDWSPIHLKLTEIMNASGELMGINSRQPVGDNAQKGVMVASAQNAVDLSDKGGIDLRELPIVAKPLETLAGANGQSVPIVIDPKVAEALNKQWALIQQQMQQGPMPYKQMKEFVMSCNKEQAAEQINQVCACIANILRLEEDAAVATPQELKEILTTIG